jgi:outer membrane protein assembly factor BamB
VEILWKYPDRAGAINVVPYADEEVAIFATGGDTRVVALDAQSGKKRWEARLALPTEYRGRGFPPGRLVGSGDVVAIPAWDLYGLDKRTGQVRWKLAPPDDFPGAGVMLGEDGDLYATGFHLYRVDAATGQVRWRADLGEQPFAPVEKDGVVYVGTRGEIPGSRGILGAGHAVALNAQTGAVLWKTPIPAPEEPANGGVIGAGALTPELYVVSSPNGRIYALDRRTGQVRWETKGSAYYGAGVVVIGDVAVTAGDAGFIEGFDLATGKQRWNVKTDGSISNPLTTTGNAVLVVNGILRAVTAEGKLLWQHQSGKFVPYSTGARVHGDRIYLGTNYGGGEGFYALRLPR